MTVSLQHFLGFELLRNLPQEDLARLATKASLAHAAKREVLISGHERHHKLGFLIDGRLQGTDFTVDGRGVGLYYIERGDYFAEQAVIDDEPLSERVIAVSKSLVLWLEPQVAKELIQKNPKISHAVMVRLSKRVRAAHAQRTLLALANPFQKLCAQILLLSKSESQNQGVISPIPTHQELALMINVSRETVTRAFQQLMLAKALDRQGSELRLLRIDYFMAVVKGAELPANDTSQNLESRGRGRSSAS